MNDESASKVEATATIFEEKTEKKRSAQLHTVLLNKESFIFAVQVHLLMREARERSITLSIVERIKISLILELDEFGWKIE